MNPVGGLVILLGFVLILIGLNGSQHRVADALRNARPGGGGNPAAPGGSTPSHHGGGGFHWPSIPKIPNIPLVPQGPVTGIPFSPVSYG